MNLQVILNAQSMTEILFFWSLFYYFSCWLAQDTTKNILLQFWAYCITHFVAYFLQLTAISTFLLITSPLAVMIFILMHQQTLQKNFIALHALKTAAHTPPDWLETIMRTALLALNKEISLTYIIERNDALGQFLGGSLWCNTTIEPQLLNLLIESSMYKPDQAIWITDQGKLVALNAHWLPQSAVKPDGAQEAIMHTATIDAIVIRVSPEHRTCDIIVNGTIIENQSVDAALRMVKKIISHKGPLPGYAYEKNGYKRSDRQQALY